MEKKKQLSLVEQNQESKHKTKSDIFFYLFLTKRNEYLPLHIYSNIFMSVARSLRHCFSFTNSIKYEMKKNALGFTVCHCLFIEFCVGWSFGFFSLYRDNNNVNMYKSTWPKDYLKIHQLRMKTANFRTRPQNNTQLVTKSRGRESVCVYVLYFGANIVYHARANLSIICIWIKVLFFKYDYLNFFIFNRIHYSTEWIFFRVLNHPIIFWPKVTYVYSIKVFQDFRMIIGSFFLADWRSSYSILTTCRLKIIDQLLNNRELTISDEDHSHIAISVPPENFSYHSNWIVILLGNDFLTRYGIITPAITYYNGDFSVSVSVLHHSKDAIRLLLLLLSL